MQEGKTVSGFKRLFAYLVTEKLPRFTCLLPARGPPKHAPRPGGVGFKLKLAGRVKQKGRGVLKGEKGRVGPAKG
ncbi:hypothetical protein FCZ07_07505, partial [Escherichia coli]|nr:hypothetical protein [Escherichia coli]